MAKITEVIKMDKNGGEIEVWLNVLDHDFLLATKKTTDNFETVEVTPCDDIYKFTLDESLRGYAVYNLLSNVQELIKTGNFRSFPKFIAEFDTLEERAKQEKE